MIYATVGTMHLEFSRLIYRMDAIAEKTDEQIIVQTGLGLVTPDHCEHFDFDSRERVLELQRSARVIVCHAGIGSVIDALEAGRPLVVIPRLKRFNEHNNDHQVDLAEAVERRGWGRMIRAIEELEPACAEPPPAYEGYKPARQPLVTALRGAIEQATSKGQ